MILLSVNFCFDWRYVVLGNFNNIIYICIYVQVEQLTLMVVETCIIVPFALIYVVYMYRFSL